ncbi:unnamed protein product [Trifolium pratense]|uniref:Uncharacterized protein n=1 Tax=Trifolium pratense TaxID=57577 RepID=A0ACB0LVT2_TRIPR|nr:unnamed protein product [Trifolium pratense]
MDSILLKEMSWPRSNLRFSRNSSHSVCFGLSSNGSMLVETNVDLHDLCWSRNDLFSSCQFIIVFRCCGFMGHYVAIDQST